MRLIHDNLTTGLGRVAAAALLAAASLPAAAGTASAAPAAQADPPPGFGAVTPGCPDGFGLDPRAQWFLPQEATDGVLICHYVSDPGAETGFRLDTSGNYQGEHAASVRAAVEAAPVADFSGMACPMIYQVPAYWVVRFLRGTQPVAEVAVDDKRYCGSYLYADGHELDGRGAIAAIRELRDAAGAAPNPDPTSSVSNQPA